MEKITNAPITPIWPLPGDSTPFCVINTAATRGRNGNHSRGGRETGPQGHILRKNKKLKEKTVWIEVQVPTWWTKVLNLEFKPWPLVIGSPLSHAWHFVVLHHGCSFFLKYQLHHRLGQDYEKNGVVEKRDRVRLNWLSGRKVGGLYGVRKAEISGSFQKERESAKVERSRISRGFRKQRKDRGASGRVLGWLTVKGLGIHSAVSSCVTISSCVVIPHCVDMSLYSASLLVLAAQFLIFLGNEVRSFFLHVWFWFFVRGGPEPLEKECHEILTSKREDRFSDPFFELVKKRVWKSILTFRS